MTNDADLREEVRSRYAEAAGTVIAGAGAANDCCHPGKTCAEVGHATGREFYGHLAEEGLPEAAVLASLGCGNPTAVADLHPGETVLDLGSGGGIDVLLSAKRVGLTGKVYGLDMTEEMLVLAIKNRDEAGATNVEFLKGYIEDIPLPANTVDVVISNCVINLSTDKTRVFAEMHRVLRPGGRIGISDVVADNELTADSTSRAWHLRRLCRRLAVVRGVRSGTPGCRVRRHQHHLDVRVPARDPFRDREGDETVVDIARPERLDEDAAKGEHRADSSGDQQSAHDPAPGDEEPEERTGEDRDLPPPLEGEPERDRRAGDGADDGRRSPR